MVNYIQYTPELANDWKQASADVRKNYPHQFRRTLDASTASQLESKLWVVDELLKLPDTIEHLRVALLGGWFANYITELLITEVEVELVHNFEIDNDVKNISYKYNKRYKDSGRYQCSVKDVMFKPLKRKENPNVPLDPAYQFDMVINCSCEHMFPMIKFHDLNKQYIDPVYVLQSTDDDQYDDHINCVGSPEELANQAKIAEVLYSGTKVLPNGMNRFMVIGYPT